MKKHVASSLAVALCAVAFVSSPAATEDAAPATAAASPHDSVPAWLKQAEQMQAPGAEKSSHGSLLPSESDQAPNLWDWENILSTFVNDIFPATEPQIKQLPARVAFGNERGAAPLVSAPAANLSSIVLTGGDASTPDPALSSSARISADLLRPGTPRQDFAALPSTGAGSLFSGGDHGITPARDASVLAAASWGLSLPSYSAERRSATLTEGILKTPVAPPCRLGRRPRLSSRG